MSDQEQVTVVFSGHMIFDSFPTFEDAEAFADHIGDSFARVCVVSTARDDKLEPFPFGLFPPVVYVRRAPLWETDDEQRIERHIEAAVEGFGGKFAGT